MMTVLWMDIPVARLVTERPGRARVLERFGIDFCCGGAKSLKDACAETGVDPAAVASALEAADAAFFEPPEVDWTRASMGELIDHIVETHHVYLCEALPRISDLLGKVCRVHGDGHPELVAAREVFEPLRLDLEDHLSKEELGLFPLLKEIEGHPAQTFESVATSVTLLVKEHTTMGRALARIRDLTHAFVVPEDACESYRALLTELKTMEADIHLHVHKENNLLFSRLAVRAE